MLGDEQEQIYLHLYVIRKNYQPTSYSSFSRTEIVKYRCVKYRCLRDVSSFFRFLFCVRPPQNSKQYWLVNMTFKVL